MKERIQTSPPTSPTSFYETVAPSISVSPGPGAHDDLFRQLGTKSPSVVYDTSDDGKASPIHAEIKLLVRTSDNGRESVEIRSLKEVAVPPPSTGSSAGASRSPIPPSSSSLPPSCPQSPQKETFSESTKIYEDEIEERVESPILTQKLVVRFQEGDLSK